MPDNLETLIADADLASLYRQLTFLELSLTSRLPHGVLYTHSGELNLASRWGAILYHARNLQSLINQHLKEI